MPSPKTQVGRSSPEDHRPRERTYTNGDAMETAISLLAEMEAEGRLRSACDLLRHVSWAEFVEEEMEEVRRRAGRTTGLARHGAVESFAGKSGADNTFWMNVDGRLGEFCCGTPQLLQTKTEEER